MSSSDFRHQRLFPNRVGFASRDFKRLAAAMCHAAAIGSALRWRASSWGECGEGQLCRQVAPFVAAIQNTVNVAVALLGRKGRKRESERILVVNSPALVP